jgi:excinuclease ABC subunit A
MENAIVVRGARVHNLQNLDVEIPLERLTVVTGVSGSGKSSLVFDTIYAEGERRYVESLSAYARQFLGQLEKPDVDSIEGLSPAIAVEQRTAGRNPRSTVGTVTEIYDYLRVLFSRAGTPHCPKCGDEIACTPVDGIVEQILALPEGTPVQILAPLAREGTGSYRKLFADLSRRGFTRVRIDGRVQVLGEGQELPSDRAQTLELLVDRLTVKPGLRGRAADSVETALREGQGLVTVFSPAGETTYSTRLICPRCGLALPELHPRLFSFNSPLGACPSCDGLGRRLEFDPDRVIPDRTKSLAEGALATFKSTEGWWMAHLEAVGARFGFTMQTPLQDYSAPALRALLHGTSEKLRVRHEAAHRRVEEERTWEGILPNLERRLRETKSEQMRAWLQSFMDERLCSACHGRRLRPESLAVTIDGHSIAEVTALTVCRAREFLHRLSFAGEREKVLERLRGALCDRLTFLEEVGLEYLTLDRSAATLSGGEAQRLRLATQIGSALRGVLYVLDEPTIGLHPRDTARLLRTLFRLRDRGNTIIVVEHDRQTIEAADHVLELGPGAGERGGALVARGTPAELRDHPASLTGRYLRGDLTVSAKRPRRSHQGPALVVEGAREHNLKNIDVAFPLQCLVAVTGVSGSGKSTLVSDVLARGVKARLARTPLPAAPFRRLRGIEHVDRLIEIDQAPIGRSPRSNPATYLGAFSAIRELFASLPEARRRGYCANRFSFNARGGRCEACAGDGVKRVEMHFLPDLYVTCDVCGGRRYNRETLEVRYKGHDIASVLEMTAESALELFGAIPLLRAKLQTLVEVGLGYLKLGQSATTLSGGEAQRVKLAAELGRRETGRTLYLCDEPTTGLHFDDVAKLLAVLDRLVDAGNTVVVIEHNLDVIAHADYVIDLGPEGGDAGGDVVFCGTPEALVRVPRSHTGACLRSAFPNLGAHPD